MSKALEAAAMVACGIGEGCRWADDSARAYWMAREAKAITAYLRAIAEDEDAISRAQAAILDARRTHGEKDLWFLRDDIRAILRELEPKETTP